MSENKWSGPALFKKKFDVQIHLDKEIKTKTADRFQGLIWDLRLVSV